MRSPSLRFRHASIQLEQLPERGHGFVATGLLKRGELLFEELGEELEINKVSSINISYQLSTNISTNQ